MDERGDESAGQKQPRELATSAPHDFEDKKRCHRNCDNKEEVTIVLLPANANERAIMAIMIRSSTICHFLKMLADKKKSKPTII